MDVVPVVAAGFVIFVDVEELVEDSEASSSTVFLLRSLRLC